MCGRFTQRFSWQQLQAFFQLLGSPRELLPRYNLAPGQDVAVVRLEQGGRRLAMLRWGLIPHWAKEPKIGARLINARAETAREKPSFRAAFAARRCLIPATGFFEWQPKASGKQPYFIHGADNTPLVFAGLWEHWEGQGVAIDSCTILTTGANKTLAPIHDRMPVILPPASFAAWLGGQDFPLGPCPSELLRAHPVSTLVNNPKNDTPRCIAAL